MIYETKHENMKKMEKNTRQWENVLIRIRAMYAFESQARQTKNAIVLITQTLTRALPGFKNPQVTNMNWQQNPQEASCVPQVNT